MLRNILIFSDGTGQAGGLTPDERISNIYKLYRATRVGPDSSIDPGDQLAYYDAGLGSRPPSGGIIKTLFRMAHNFLSQATGFGLTTNIIDCYEMLIRLWRPGDRIFLFGFSRGAYTVRCLAGILANCGIPTRLEGRGPMKYDEGTARRLATIAVKKVYQHTASVPRSKSTLRQNELMDQRAVLAREFCETYASRQEDASEYPYFIGVFDTVASIASMGDYSHYHGAGLGRCLRGPVVDFLSVHRHFCQTGRLRRARAHGRLHPLRAVPVVAVVCSCSGRGFCHRVRLVRDAAGEVRAAGRSETPLAHTDDLVRAYEL
jgi:uncharacterized protein (DUF2235 family)